MTVAAVGRVVAANVSRLYNDHVDSLQNRMKRDEEEAKDDHRDPNREEDVDTLLLLLCSLCPRISSVEVLYLTCMKTMTMRKGEVEGEEEVQTTMKDVALIDLRMTSHVMMEEVGEVVGTNDDEEEALHWMVGQNEVDDLASFLMVVAAASPLDLYHILLKKMKMMMESLWSHERGECRGKMKTCLCSRMVVFLLMKMTTNFYQLLMMKMMTRVVVHLNGLKVGHKIDLFRRAFHLFHEEHRELLNFFHTNYRLYHKDCHFYHQIELHRDHGSIHLLLILHWDESKMNEQDYPHWRGTMGDHGNQDVGKGRSMTCDFLHHHRHHLHTMSLEKSLYNAYLDDLQKWKKILGN